MAADTSHRLCKGVLGCDRVHAEMLDAVADGRFPVDGLESLVTRRIPLEDLVEKGIKALLHETDKHGEWFSYFWIYSTTDLTGSWCFSAVKILVYPDLKPIASGAKM